MSNEQSLTNIYNTMVSNNEIQRNISQQTLVSELEKLTRKLEQKKALNVSVAGRVFSKFRFTKALEKKPGSLYSRWCWHREVNADGSLF